MLLASDAVSLLLTTRQVPARLLADGRRGCQLLAGAQLILGLLAAAVSVSMF